MFTTSCFIQKNTPELRKKLLDMGYKQNIYDKNDNPWLAVNHNMFISVSKGFERLPEFNIDCGDNEDLFLALAALRDDKTPDYQWFVWDDIYVDNRFKQYIPGEHWEGWWWFEVHKATVEELIEHFLSKNYET